MFQRLFQPQADAVPTSDETATVRAIVARLEALPAGRARYLARFAYVLSRAAGADLEISDEETAQMEAILRDDGGLDPGQATLVVEMAKLEAGRDGATADFLVTREFAADASHEEKLALLRCCFLVVAAGGTINAEETNAVNEIARELDIPAGDLNRIREAFVDQISAIQAQRRLLRGS